MFSKKYRLTVPGIIANDIFRGNRMEGITGFLKQIVKILK
jgi:hypothetical protein